MFYLRKAISLGHWVGAELAVPAMYKYAEFPQSVYLRHKYSIHDPKD